MASGTKKHKFSDALVIYFSKEDECWIAHSLRTDQFGTGECVLDAVVDGMKAVDQVVELQKKDPSVKLLRDSPAEIKAIAHRAKKLRKGMN